MPELPSNERSWLKEVKDTDFQTKTIHSFESAASGSKIGFTQFLLLRILWVKRPAEKLSSSSEYGKWEILKKHIDTAHNHLGKVSGWEQYKSTFSNNLAWHREKGFISLGTFSLVRLYQLNSSLTKAHTVFIPKLDFSPRKTRSHTRAQARESDPATPTRPSVKGVVLGDSNPVTPTQPFFKDTLLGLDSLFLEDLDIDLYISPFSPPNSDLAHNLNSINDEQIVKIALLLYLQALLINFGGINVDWTPERRALIVRKNDSFFAINVIKITQ